MMKKDTFLKKSLLLLAAIFLAGLVFQKFGNQALYSSDSLQYQIQRFNEVLNYVNRFYVEPPDNEKLINGAIDGMLGELDPHSVYLPPKNYEQEMERFEGHFEGIGIEFVVLNKILTVISPIVGGPSELVGLLPGDEILKIDNESAFGITNEEVFKKLRGPKGTKVSLTIRRPGQQDTFDVVITRDTIPIYSISAAFILDDGVTGYIQLGRFAKTTTEELDKALQKLESQGMKQLILDLRGNSGGLLDQAIQVSDRFLPGNKKVVYTRGRIRSSDSDFYSTPKSKYFLRPLTVMIDHGSASASEIVAGAIQDLDRGLVVGQTSFGKGLVQSQLPLRDGSALRLTVARYYTPSGRLIQRPYSENSMDYYTEAFDDSARTKKTDSSQVFFTAAGRKVFGGGGITPDSVFTAEKITRFTFNMISKRVFFELGSLYAANHREWAKDFSEFKKSFVVDAAVLEQLKSILNRQNIEFNEKAFNTDEIYIKLLIKAEIARHLWDSEHYYMIRASGDPEIKLTVSLMPKAAQITQLIRK